MKKILFCIASVILVFNLLFINGEAAELIDLPEITQLQTDGRILDATFSNDDKYIVTGDSAGEITVFNAATGTKVNSWEGAESYREVSGVLYSPDGQRLITYDDSYSGLIYVWDIQTGTLLEELETSDGQQVQDIAFNEDGTVLYTASDDGKIIYWNIVSGSIIEEFMLSEMPSSLAYNHKNNHLAIGLSDSSVNVRHAATGEYIFTSKSYNDSYWLMDTQVKYSPDGKILYLGDSAMNQPYLFEVENGYQDIYLEENDFKAAWISYDLNPNHRYVAVVTDSRELNIYDSESKALIAQESLGFYDSYVKFNNKGNRLVAGDMIYDTKNLFNELTSILLSPSKLYMGIDDTQSFTLLGNYSNGTKKTIPSTEVTWSSNNTDVVKFNFGKFQAVKAGRATIAATYKGMTTTAEIQVNAQQFQDLKAIHLDPVNYLVGKGITGGISKTQFGTNATIKRVDAAIMIAKALELNVNAAPESGFKDVPERGQAQVNALKATGIISGKTKTSFGANDQITRGEMAIILQRAYHLTPGSTQHKFTDVGSRYNDAVSSLVRYKVVSDDSYGRYNTSVPITRGDFAIFLYNAEIIK